MSFNLVDKFKLKVKRYRPNIYADATYTGKSFRIRKVNTIKAISRFKIFYGTKIKKKLIKKSLKRVSRRIINKNKKIKASKNSFETIKLLKKNSKSSKLSLDRNKDNNSFKNFYKNNRKFRRRSHKILNLSELKPLTRKEFKSYRKNKNFLKRQPQNRFRQKRYKYRELRYHKKIMKKRSSRFYKLRRSLSRPRNTFSRYNRKLSRRKLVRRFSSKKLTRILKRRRLFSSSQKATKFANIDLLKSFFNKVSLNSELSTSTPILKNVRNVALNETDDEQLLKHLFSKFNNLLLKSYIFKSGTYLEMTQEEKLDYLDKLDIPLAKKLEMLNL